MAKYAIRYLDANLNWLHFGEREATCGEDALDDLWREFCLDGTVATLRLNREWLEALDAEGNVSVPRREAA